MSEFKKGDRVRVTDPNGMESYGAYDMAEGDEGEVVRTDPGTSLDLQVVFDNDQDWWVSSHDVELIEDLKSASAIDWGTPGTRPVSESDLIEVAGYTGPARTFFEGGGMREPQDGKPRFDLLMPLDVPFTEQFLTRCAVHMAAGAEKYEDRNWEKFSDEEALARTKASAMRHMVQWLSGEKDEDHAAAVFFNLMAAEYVQGRISGKF